MFVDRLLYPVTALGPGNRVAIWVAGCHHYCEKCANPELWEQHTFQKITPKKMAAAIRATVKNEDLKLTITGGEPMDQAEEISEMITLLKDLYENTGTEMEILIYTGYRLEELPENAAVQKLLSQIDVLIDGEYVDTLNDNQVVLRGSSNQRIHYFNKEVQPHYETYLSEGRKIQNFIYDYKTVSVGIHNRGVVSEG